MSEERAIRSIAVAGGGIVGLSAATAFARALRATRVTIVENSPDLAALADQLPTARPGIAAFHRFIGLDEGELVASGIATHHLGSIVENWSATGEPWIHAFGPYGKPVGAIAFDRIWVEARRAGKALPYDRYSMGAALARAGKFVHPAKDPEFVGSRFQYGLRFDPELYRGRLRALGDTLNVEAVAADIVEVERGDGGGIRAVKLTGGRRIEADLFVDCTGPSARLLDAIDDSFEDWDAWMPFDRVAVSSGPGGDIPATADRIRASPGGWAIEWPLRGKTMRAEIGAVNGVPVTRGRRLRPWVHNVLAIGDSATALDPLHGFHLELAQAAILLALEVLPARDFGPIETQEYNRRAEQVTSRVRDFVALHYLRGPWRELASIAPSDSLARTLDQYEHRGRLPFHEEESVTRDSWSAALLSLGVIPCNTDPHIASVALDQAISAMKRLAAEIDRIPPTLPDYGDYLARMKG